MGGEDYPNLAPLDCHAWHRHLRQFLTRPYIPGSAHYLPVALPRASLTSRFRMCLWGSFLRTTELAPLLRVISGLQTPSVQKLEVSQLYLRLLVLGISARTLIQVVYQPFRSLLRATLLALRSHLQVSLT